MTHKTLLSKLGLEHPADKIYMVLLRLHRATIAELSRETGIHRPVLYKHLPILVDKHLVSQVKVGKRTMYMAENPQVLQGLVDTIKSELEETIPELSRMYEGNQKKPIVRYVEGRNAIKKIYEDVVRRSKKGDAYYRYESPRDLPKVKRYYPELYYKIATGVNSQIERYIITNEESAPRRRPRIMRHVKAIPKSHDPFDYNITQIIHKDTVAFVDFDTETATVIENKRFADFQLKIFKMLFGKL
jgi:sugar-specific transcriptional regulator TrmB